MNFKLGDKVVISDRQQYFYFGCTGTIVEMCGHEFQGYPITYVVLLDPINFSGKREVNFNAHNLQLHDDYVEGKENGTT